MQDSLINLITSQFKLNLNGDHGIRHWNRVAEIGVYLAKQTGANIQVVDLFAYLHDAKREDELFDPEHGQRAAGYAKELYDSGVIGITPDQMDQLAIACRDHNNSSATSQDITIQTCWDADRLDLWRVGIIPDPTHLFTDFAKQSAVINKFAK